MIWIYSEPGLFTLDPINESRTEAPDSSPDCERRGRDHGGGMMMGASGGFARCSLVGSDE